MAKYFEFLPSVDVCCFCVPVRLGTIYIAIFSIIISLVDLYHSLFGDSSKYNTGSFWDFISYILLMVGAFLAILHFVLSIHLLVNVAQSSSKMADYYLAVLCACTVFELVFGSVLAIRGKNYCKKHCEEDICSYSGAAMGLVSIIISVLVNVYFAIVVTSFMDEADGVFEEA